MKKTFLFGLIILIVATLVLYFYPVEKVMAKETITNTTPDAALRNFSGYKELRWWPGKVENDSVFNYKNTILKVDYFRVNALSLSTLYNGVPINYQFDLVQLSLKQTKLVERFVFTLSNNPFIRLKQLFQLAHARAYINELSNELGDFFSKEERIYGMKIERQKVQDSALISTKQNFDHYPTTTDIYSLVNSLKAYIRQQGTTERNYPFLNIRILDSTHYEAMVAIATPYSLPETNNFKLKKMVLGNILFATVTGGLHTVKLGEQQMEYFVFDNRKSSPAIPYQSLITDRTVITDTGKWVTGLYYPIFN